MPAKLGQTGAITDLTTTAQSVVLAAAPNVGVTLLAGTANTNTVYYGFASTITTNTTLSGYPVPSGATGFIPASALSAGTTFWLIGSAASTLVTYKAE